MKNKTAYLLMAILTLGLYSPLSASADTKHNGLWHTVQFQLDSAHNYSIGVYPYIGPSELDCTVDSVSNPFSPITVDIGTSTPLIPGSSPNKITIIGSGTEYSWTFHHTEKGAGYLVMTPEASTSNTVNSATLTCTTKDVPDEIITSFEAFSK